MRSGDGMMIVRDIYSLNRKYKRFYQKKILKNKNKLVVDKLTKENLF